MPSKEMNDAVQSLLGEFCQHAVSRGKLHRLPFFSAYSTIKLCPDHLHPSFQSALPVASLGLPARANQASKSLGVVSLGELLLTSTDKFTDLQNCGISTLESARNTIEGVLLQQVPAITLDTSSCVLFLESVFRPVLPDSRMRDILCARIGIDGEELTLKEVGSCYGITRERVRQLEKKAHERLLSLDSQMRLVPLRDLLRHTLSVLNGAASFEAFAKAMASQLLWATAPPLRVVETLFSIFPEEFHTVETTWCIATSYQCYQCARFLEMISEALDAASQAGIKPFPVSSLCSTLVDAIAQQCETCEASSGEPIVPEAIIQVLMQTQAEAFVGYRCDDSGILPESVWAMRCGSLQNAVEKAVLEAPGPICCDEIRDVVASASGDERDSLTVAQVRTALNNTLVRQGEIVLWNRGGEFVHASKVNLYLPIVNTLEELVIDKLRENSVPQMSLYNIFNEHEEECNKAGLPSAWALFSLLKLRAHPRLRFLRAPYVALHGATSRRKQSVVDMLNERVYSEEEGVSKKEFRKYATSVMGMTKVHLSSTMQLLTDVLRTDSGYFHAEHFEAESAKFRMLVLQVKKMLEQRGHVSVRLLFKEKRVTCVQLGITGPRMLASVLEYFASDSIGEVAYPMIRVATEDSESEARSVYREVENHILDSCGPCSREAIATYFVEHRGYSQQRVNNALQNLRTRDDGTLLPYGHSLFVHEKTIGWNKEKQTQLMTTVMAYYNERSSARCIHVTIPSLLDEVYLELPDLDHCVDWSEQLLFSLVRRDSAILPLGNANRAFLVPSDSNCMQCFGDFVKWVLIDRFQGGANLKEFTKCLRDMDIVRKSLTPSMLNGYGGLVMSRYEIRVTETT